MSEDYAGHSPARREYTQEERDLFDGYLVELDEALDRYEPIPFHKLLEEALKNGFPIDYSGRLLRNTLLERAFITQSSDTIINLLLDNGADVNVCDRSGWNVLMYAAYYGCMPEIFRRILENTKDIYRISLGKYKNYDALILLCESYIKAASTADKQRCFEELQMLLKAGAPTDRDIYKHFTNAVYYDRKIPPETAQQIRELEKYVRTWGEQHKQLKEQAIEYTYDYAL